MTQIAFDIPAPSTKMPQKPWIKPHKRYQLMNARLVDTKDAKIYEHCSIDIADGIIKRLSKQDEATTLNEDMLRWSRNESIVLVDLQGKYVMPGLIDCHVHFAMPPGEEHLSETLKQDSTTSLLRQPYLGRQMLDRGFTTVRDCGGATLQLKEAFEEGIHAGPRLFIAGHAISQTGGHGDIRGAKESGEACCGGHVNNIGRVADGRDQCLVAAREEIRRGADFIKIVLSGGVVSPTDRLTSTQYTPDEVKAFTQVAADSGTYVSAHAYTPQAILHAITNGVRVIEHGNLLDAQTASLMARKECFLVPTLITYSAMASPQFAGFLPTSIAAKNLEVLRAGFRSVQLATEKAVPMAYGSDLVGPMQSEQLQEFCLLKEAGQSASQILQAATINGARLLQQDSQLGRIKEGYFADLVILNASPLDDITILSRPEQHLLAVMKDGRVVTSRWSKLSVDGIEASQIE